MEVEFSKEEIEQLDKNVSDIVAWILENVASSLRDGEEIAVPLGEERSYVPRDVKVKKGEVWVGYGEYQCVSKNKKLAPLVAYKLCREWEDVKASLAVRAHELTFMHNFPFKFKI